jgi:hypothetical protein
MNWEPITVLAAVAAAIFAALAWRTSAQGVSLRKQELREKRELGLGLLKQTLRDVKWILENPPLNGFDHSPKPNLGLDQIAEALATTDLLLPEQAERVRRTRDALLEADRLITETQDPAMAQAWQTRFRERFRPISLKTLSAIDEALKVL